MPLELGPKNNIHEFFLWNNCAILSFIVSLYILSIECVSLYVLSYSNKEVSFNIELWKSYKLSQTFNASLIVEPFMGFLDTNIIFDESLLVNIVYLILSFILLFTSF